MKTIRKLITLNEWVKLQPGVQNIFDSAVRELKISTVLSAPDMFLYFSDKYGERDFYKPFDYENSANNTNAVKQASTYILLYAKSHKYEYDKLVDTLSLEYNPIENYSMTEKSKDTRTPDITQTNKGKNTNTVGVDTSITTGKTTFDKSIDFINDTKTTNTGTNTGTQDINATVTTAGNETTEHELTRSGNIGVTTSQQMIESERKLAMFSVVDLFIKAIADIILIGVY